MALQTYRSAADHVDTIVTSGCGNKRKRGALAAKWKPSKTSVDQVTTQIELPLDHRSQCPLDLVVVKIIFGHLIKAFRHTSHTTGTGASAGNDTPSSKRTHTPSMKSMLVPK
jgi:hypothetical protein